MIHDQLKKVIKLAKKTGDRLIVFNDQEPEMAYVVMSLDEYEKIAIQKKEVKNLTEPELLDKINRDIAIWKNEQEMKEEQLPKNPANNDGFYEYGQFAEIGEDSDNETLFDQPLTENKNVTKKAKAQWAIPEDRKDAAEEIIEEDRQYLEEITF